MLGYETKPTMAINTTQGVALEDLEKAGIRVAQRRFKAKDIIFAPGDPDEQLYFLLKGTVRLYKIYGDYKEVTTALLKDGDPFGRLSLVEEGWQDAFAEALTDTRGEALRLPKLRGVDAVICPTAGYV